MDWSEWTKVLGDLNYLAVLAATLVGGMAIGSVWYARKVFGNAWMKLAGLSDSDIKKANLPLAMAETFVLTFISALALAIFERLLSVDTWLEGLNFGLFVGLFLVSTAFLVNYLFEQKPLALWKINAGYATLNLTAMAVILAIWR